MPEFLNRGLEAIAGLFKENPDRAQEDQLQETRFKLASDIDALIFALGTGKKINQHQHDEILKFIHINELTTTMYVDLDGKTPREKIKKLSEIIRAQIELLRDIERFRKKEKL